MNNVSFIKWNDKLSTGIPEIDQQHIELINILNRLHQKQKKLEKPATLNLVKELKEYIKIHFHTEESLFKIIDYSGKPEHLMEHNEFRIKVKALIGDYLSNKIDDIPEDVFNYFKNWIKSHIIQEDKLYGTFYNSIKDPAVLEKAETFLKKIKN